MLFSVKERAVIHMKEGVTRILDSFFCPDPFVGVFDESKSLFIHIPKAAGSSVAEGIYGRQVGHRNFRYFQARNRFKAEEYFTFSFVRNPYDRFVSAYNYILTGGSTPGDLKNSNILLDYSDINEFVKKWVNKKNICFSGISHFIPQYMFLCGKEFAIPRVKFVGKYEKIDEDFSYICSRLNLKRTLPEINSSMAKSDIHVKLTSESKDIIYKNYWPDFYYFGYEQKSSHSYKGNIDD